MLKQRDKAQDLIKFLAIIGVLFIHILGNKREYFGIFWYAQAVPIFMVLMGYNATDQLPSAKKLLKFYIPYLLIFFSSFALCWMIGTFPLSKIDMLPIGLLPKSGPGSYWISLFFVFLFVIPFYKQLMDKYSTISVLFLVFFLSYLFEYQWNIGAVNGSRWLYASNPIRYSLCVCLGIFMKKIGADSYIRKIFIFSVFSAIYLYIINYTGTSLPYLRFVNMGWATGENCIAAFYPSILVAVLLFSFENLIKNDNIILNTFIKVGRNTYYIFLFQIIWFCIPNVTYRSLLTIPFCIFGGYLLKKVSILLIDIISKCKQ